ncbi:hypothetical protein BC828DRAFT_381796 [Blastocladiella britannica]|nr:hypothetical protein BC828DRAFT_381796 [Blastocladiella britannica]
MPVASGLGTTPFLPTIAFDARHGSTAHAAIRAACSCCGTTADASCSGGFCRCADAAPPPPAATIRCAHDRACVYEIARAGDGDHTRARIHCHVQDRDRDQDHARDHAGDHGRDRDQDCGRATATIRTMMATALSCAVPVSFRPPERRLLVFILEIVIGS